MNNEIIIEKEQKIEKEQSLCSSIISIIRGFILILFMLFILNIFLKYIESIFGITFVTPTGKGISITQEWGGYFDFLWSIVEWLWSWLWSLIR